MEFFAAHQRAKKVMSVIPGLVDFAIGLMNSVLNLPDRQGIGWGGGGGDSNYRRTVVNPQCYLKPALRASFSTDFLCTLCTVNYQSRKKGSNEMTLDGFWSESEH